VQDRQKEIDIFSLIFQLVL